MRLVYLGTPDAAVPPLRALVDAGHDITLVVTQPDRRRTRGRGVDPSPVKHAAIELGLPVLTPNKASDIIDDVASSGAELGVVVAFGQLLRPALLDALPLGFVNLHFSLLPRWRGAAPVERAILAGDRETGVGLMKIEEGLDTGPVYAERLTPIESNDTAATVRDRLVALGIDLLREYLPRVATMEPRAQKGEPTYAEKLSPDDFRLDATRPVQELARVVQAGDPKPGAWLRAGGIRFKVFGPIAAPGLPGRKDPVLTKAGLVTGDGLLLMREIQPEGRRRMKWESWWRGQQVDLPVDPPEPDPPDPDPPEPDAVSPTP